MNIWALRGHKVKATNITPQYYPVYDDKALRHLVIGKTYTVDYTSVGRSWTVVYLNEIPDISFSTVHFEDIEEQPTSWQQQHIDFWYYSGLIRKKRSHLSKVNFQSDL